MKKRKVFILGGGGFIGFKIVEILSERKNYDITIGDNFHLNQDDSEFYEFVKKNNIKVINKDFTLKSSFDLLENDYDDFYMLASMIGVNNTLENPHEVIRVNTALIYNSLEWIKTNSAKNILFTSTSECYSGTIEKFNYNIPTDENIPLCIDPIDHPRFTYAVTKMLGESGFLNYCRVLKLNCKIIRYNNVFGPRMGFGHLIPHLAERFLRNENPFKIYGAKQTRSFCYIDDGALGTIQAMECDKAKNEIFHIGSEDEITVEELVIEAGKFFNFSGKYVEEKTYPGSVERRCPDLTKAKSYFDYKVNTDWKSGLHKSLEWYKNYFLNNKSKRFFKSPEELKIK
tara:strand:- start:83 stop:1111 length:1029 start_codon:yes stop_codon:yes gene_type:complete